MIGDPDRPDPYENVDWEEMMGAKDNGHQSELDDIEDSDDVDWEEMMGANEEGLYEGDSDYADLRDILENIADTFDQ